MHACVVFSFVQKAFLEVGEGGMCMTEQLWLRKGGKRVIGKYCISCSVFEIFHGNCVSYSSQFLVRLPFLLSLSQPLRLQNYPILSPPRKTNRVYHPPINQKKPLSSTQIISNICSLTNLFQPPSSASIHAPPPISHHPPHPHRLQYLHRFPNSRPPSILLCQNDPIAASQVSSRETTNRKHQTRTDGRFEDR